MTLVLDFNIPVPETRDRQAQEAQRSVARSAAHVLEHLFERSTPQEMITAAQILEKAAARPPASGDPDKAALVRDLTGERTLSEVERFALEASALSRAFALRRTLLEGALSAPQVASLLGMTRQSVHEKAKQRGTLLAVLDRGSLRFPAWQFDPEGTAGLVEGLPEVLQALEHTSPLGKASWLTRPSPYFEGHTPLETLRRGEKERVLEAAWAVGVL